MGGNNQVIGRITATTQWFLAFAVVGLTLLVSARPTVPAEAPAGAVKADMGFPPVGTKWVSRTVEEPGETKTQVFTVMQEGTYKDKQVFQMSDGVETIVLDRATRNWIATLRDGKVDRSASPHNGELSFPIWVGKSWVARYRFYDSKTAGPSHYDVTYSWKVTAYEDVIVPAGTFKAFRLEGSNPFATTKIWYSPELHLVVKRIWERETFHYRGPGKSTTEVVEYPAK